jgi:hypothetical protein
LKLELDTNTSGGVTRTWNDITADLLKFKIEQGRNFELNTFSTGTQEYTLDNLKGNYRMFNTAGAYYPNLKPWRRVRLSCLWKDVTYYLAYGYIESITPTRARNWSEVTMKCVDALQILAQRALIPTALSVTTSTGVTNGDLVFSTRSAAVGGPLVARPHHRWIGGPPPGKLAVPPGPAGISVQYVETPLADPGVGNVSVDTATGLITVAFQAGSSPTGRRAVRIMGDINGHAIAGQMISATLAPGSNGSGHINNYGPLALVGGFPAQLSSARITAVLDLIGWPAGDRLIGTGTNTIQPTTFVASDDVKALTHCMDVMTSEAGQLFADGQNRIVFQGQTARTSSPFNASSVTFSDLPGAGEYEYSDLVPVEDNQHIYNNIIASRNGGATVIVSDSTSITDNNQADFPYQTILSTDAATTTLANALLTKYKTAKLRYDSVVLEPFVSSGLWDWLLSLGISNQVTVKETPPGSSALSTPCFIEKITHEAEPPVKWTTTYMLSPV